MEQVTVDQGTQPHFGPVRVGIMRAGLKQGVPTVRLAVRTPEDERIIDVPEGDSVSVPGRGTITVVEVRRRSAPTEREKVTLAWEAAPLG